MEMNGEYQNQGGRFMNTSGKTANSLHGGINNQPYTALGIIPFDGYEFNNGQEYKDSLNDFGKFDLRMRTRMKSSHQNY